MPLYRAGSRRTSTFVHTHPRVLDRAFARLFDGEKAQDRRATLPASFLPSLLSFLLFSSSFPLSLLFTRSPSTGYSLSLSLSLSLFLSSPACLRQWKRSVRGSRSRARICGPARWMASQRERSRCVSLFVFLAVDIRYDRLPSSSSCSCSIGPKTIHDGIGSSPLPPASCSGGTSFPTIPRFTRSTPLGWIGRYEAEVVPKRYCTTYFGTN